MALGFLISIVVSMGMLIKASKVIPIGTAYAVWAGIGAVGAVLMGIMFFKEPTDFWNLIIRKKEEKTVRKLMNVLKIEAEQNNSK